LPSNMERAMAKEAEAKFLAFKKSGGFVAIILN
jgi:hypothetical protein